MVMTEAGEVAATAEQAHERVSSGDTLVLESMRFTLDRLVAEVVDAVADGMWGVPEASRLHAWLHVEFIPWCENRHEAAMAVEDAAAIKSDCGLLTGLNSLLHGSRGQEASKWARQLHRTGTILLARLEYLPD